MDRRRSGLRPDALAEVVVDRIRACAST